MLWVYRSSLHTSFLPFFLFHSCSSSGGSHSPTAEEMWQVKQDCFSLAILSPLDTDWTASHSHSGISVWTVMSKIHEMPANYCLSPSLGIFPTTLSQCVCASNMKILRSSSFNVFYPTIPSYSVKLLPALSPHKPLYVVVASRRRMRSLCSQ